MIHQTFYKSDIFERSSTTKSLFKTKICASNNPSHHYPSFHIYHTNHCPSSTNSSFHWLSENRGYSSFLIVLFFSFLSSSLRYLFLLLRFPIRRSFEHEASPFSSLEYFFSSFASFFEFLSLFSLSLVCFFLQAFAATQSMSFLSNTINPW